MVVVVVVVVVASLNGYLMPLVIDSLPRSRKRPIFAVTFLQHGSRHGKDHAYLYRPIQYVIKSVRIALKFVISIIFNHF